MNKPVITDIVPQLGTNLSPANLDPKAFAKALKQAGRQALIASGMTQEAFRVLIGSRTAEDREALALQMQRLAENLAILAFATRQGSLAIETPRVKEELPWHPSLEDLPNIALRNALKQQLLTWAESGMTLERWMDLQKGRY
jgi:hypothetical protein